MQVISQDCDNPFEEDAYNSQAIHSSMRQWGSSLNHNGMSLFIATVPQGTQLYHGTSKEERINGTQWLAFEPEHALVFARSHRGPPPGKGGPPGPENGGPHDDDDGEEWHPPERVPDDDEWHVGSSSPPKKDLKARHHPHEDPPPLTHTAAQRERARLPFERQEPLRDGQEQLQGGEEDDSHGYLHTYLPKRNLRLLYLDGQSAAKSDKGTLDMQDIVLLHHNPPPKDGSGSPSGPRRSSDDFKPDPKAPGKYGKSGRKHGNMGGPMSEGFRAEHLCAMASHEWESRIDGFLRMEEGFEIILCDFQRDLEVQRITQVKQSSGSDRGPRGPGRDEGAFAYYQAVASRFDGIGGGRVRIDYENMLSLFADEEAIFFDEKNLPRVKNESATLEPILQRIKTMILSEPNSKERETTNWQATADMIQSRYSNRIAHLSSGALASLEIFKKEIDYALRPFIDYGFRNAKEEIRRCATQFLTRHPAPSDLAAHAVLDVSARICASLTHASEKETLEEGVKMVRELKEWLAWTGWKKCGDCGVEGVCFVPIWPLGGVEEMREPKCVKGMNETGRGYWGDMPGGPPPRDKKDW